MNSNNYVDKERVDVHITVSTIHIKIFNIPIHIIKLTWFITFGESVSVYKTIYTTHINILQIKYWWENVWLFIEKFTPITSPIWKYPSISNVWKE